MGKATKTIEVDGFKLKFSQVFEIRRLVIKIVRTHKIFLGNINKNKNPATIEGAAKGNQAVLKADDKYPVKVATKLLPKTRTINPHERPLLPNKHRVVKAIIAPV